MFACLPWYDFDELRPATDALWRRVAAILRDEGIDGVPARLDRALHYEDQWDSGELLIGQACGYDVAIAHAHNLRIVATPRYALQGCTGSSYRSFVVVRADDPATQIADLRGRRCVINTPTSHSGMNVLRSLVAPLACDGAFFASVTVSGAHERSLDLLTARAVDVAAIDCITHGLLARNRPTLLDGTQIIGETVAVPAPPYVTSVHTPPAHVDSLRSALRAAIADPNIAEPLGLAGLDDTTLEHYQPILALERTADRLGYTELSSAL